MAQDNQTVPTMYIERIKTDEKLFLPCSKIDDKVYSMDVLTIRVASSVAVAATVFILPIVIAIARYYNP